MNIIHVHMCRCIQIRDLSKGSTLVVGLSTGIFVCKPILWHCLLVISFLRVLLVVHSTQATWCTVPSSDYLIEWCQNSLASIQKKILGPQPQPDLHGVSEVRLVFQRSTEMRRTEGTNAFTKRKTAQRPQQILLLGIKHKHCQRN